MSEDKLVYANLMALNELYIKQTKVINRNARILKSLGFGLVLSGISILLLQSQINDLEKEIDELKKKRD